MRVKIARKEAKESTHWLKLLDIGDQSELQDLRNTLVQESRELKLILNSIVQKFK